MEGACQTKTKRPANRVARRPAVSVAALDREKILKEAVRLFKTELCHFPVYSKRSESQNVRRFVEKLEGLERNDLVERINSELKPQRRLRFDEFLLRGLVEPMPEELRSESVIFDREDGATSSSE